MSDTVPCRSVVVVGGGLAGVLFIFHLSRLAKGPLAITILEPRTRLGAGVAYSGAEPSHVTNVPAASMSVDPDDPGAFARWIERHGDRRKGDERDVYPRRWLFGDYVGELLERALADRPGRRADPCPAARPDVARTADGFVVETESRSFAADAVVLATGNPAPQLPDVLKSVSGSAQCIADPWAPKVLADVPSHARVLIIGTGLTMGDTVAVLRASGHTGEIVAISRRGQISRRGLASAVEPFGDFRQPPSTALGLLRLFRAEVRRAAAAGSSWYAVLAAARREAWSLWAALPEAERRCFVRHLRLYYEVHRHIMAGPVYDMIAEERRSGGLQVLAARLRQVRLLGSAVEVDLQPRGVGPESLRREMFNVIVNCTGPSYATLTRTDPFWQALTRRGLVRADEAGIGPKADRQGRAIDASGTAQPDLLLGGTLARSAFGELTGAREISAEARLAVGGLLDFWAKRPCEAVAAIDFAFSEQN